MKQVTGTLCFLIALVAGLIPQSADHPLILAPFLLIAAFLLVSGEIARMDRRDVFLFVLLAFWAVCGVSGLFSTVAFPAKVSWIILGALPLAYLQGKIISSRFFFSALSIIGAVAGLFATWQALHGVDRPSFPFDDANLLGLLLTCGALASLHDKRTLFLFPLCAGAMILTESRTALLALGFGGLLPVWMIFRDTAQRRILIYAIPAIIVFLGALSLATGFHDRLTDITHGAQGRIALWTAAIRMAGIEPFTGLGLGTFHLHYPPFRLAGDNSLGWMVHMEPLQILVECGWGAFLLLYALFVLGALRVRSLFRAKPKTPHTVIPDKGSNADRRSGIQRMRAAKLHKIWIPFVPATLTGRANGMTVSVTNPYEPVYKAGRLARDHVTAASLLCAFFLAMHLTYPLHVAGFLVMAGGCFAILSREKTESQTEPPVFWALSGPLFLAIIGMVLIALQTIYTFMIWSEVKHAAHLHNQKKFDALMRECLDKGDPDFPDCKIMAARFITLAPRGDQTEARRLLDLADRNHPLNPEIPFLRARIAGASAESQDFLRESIRRNPLYWPARKALILNALERKNIAEAQKYLEEGLIYPYSPTIRHDIETTGDMIHEYKPDQTDHRAPR